MAQYIEITDNIISLVKYTHINSFADGLSKLNIIHHFIANQINNQIRILKFMVNTTHLDVDEIEFNSNENSDSDNEDLKYEFEVLKNEIMKYEEIPDIVINKYESFVEVRNFYLSEINFQHFNKLQRYMIPLLKQIELLYYDNYDLDNLDELLTDIENKLKYIDEFHEDIENEMHMKIKVDEGYDKCESTYNILTYLHDLYLSIANRDN